MKILFLHGWQSVVGGVKPSFLAKMGHNVSNPALDDHHFSAAVQTAQHAFELHVPDVIVGSSRGGAVAMNMYSGTVPLVLLCPAWKCWGSADTIKPNSILLHSPADKVIPYSESELLLRNSGLPAELLIAIGKDHRLADVNSLAAMEWACRILSTGQTLHGGGEVKFARADRNCSSQSQDEGLYICDACGEEIVIPLDLTQGSLQTYVEDCPVCCQANTIHVHIERNGLVHVRAEPEQDHQ